MGILLYDECRQGVVWASLEKDSDMITGDARELFL